MPDLLGAATVPAEPVWVIVVRLLLAMLFGAMVAFVYRRATRVAAGSFTNTLILLAILIAMVTQVIGDNVARAFSLVGALSIVRFRTVVRDTQDTAYVIAAVAVGMAVGAGHFWVAAAGVAVVALAAFATRAGQASETAADTPYGLTVRLALGLDEAQVVSPVLARFVSVSRVTGVATARQGGSIDVSYRLALADERQAQAMVNAINRLDGVQSVELVRAAAVAES